MQAGRQEHGGVAVDVHKSCSHIFSTYRRPHLFTQSPTGSWRAAVRGSLRSLWIKPGVTKLLKRDGSSFGKIFVEKALDLRPPMIIARVKLVWAGLILVYVAAIIAPARRFRHDRIFDVRGPMAKALCGERRA